MVETNWNVDIENESVINDLIVEYLIESDEFQKVFFSNKDENKKGSDIQIISEIHFEDSAIKHVDLKTAANHRKLEGEKSISTFAFELQFRNNKNEKRSGWFYGKQYSLTNLYLLSWVWVYDKSKLKKSVKLTRKDISQIEFVLIEKNVVKNYLKEHKLTEVNYEQVIEKFDTHVQNEITEGNSGYALNIKQNNGQLESASLSLFKPKEYANEKYKTPYLPRIHYTANLAEKPYNVLIAKDVLIELVNNSDNKGFHRIIKF